MTALEPPPSATLGYSFQIAVFAAVMAGRSWRKPVASLADSDGRPCGLLRPILAGRGHPRKQGAFADEISGGALSERPHPLKLAGC